MTKTNEPLLFRSFFLFYFFSSFIFAQSSIGFVDNHVGVQGVIYNPANILDTFHKIDVNLFSFGGHAGNDYFAINPFDLIRDANLGIKEIKEITSKARNESVTYNDIGIKPFEDYIISKDNRHDSKFYGSAFILGPSFLWNFNKRNAIAFSSSIKAYGNAYDINIKLYDDVFNQTTEVTLDQLKNDFLTVPSNFSQGFTWAEVGFSYAGLAKHTATDFLKLGFTLKFLRGLKTFGVFSDGLTGNINYNATNPLMSTVDFKGNVTTFNSLESANFGMGLDIGLVYEKRTQTLPNHLKDKNQNIYFSKAPYIYKVSLSFTNIGFLTFDRVKIVNYLTKDELPVGNFDPFSYLTAETVGTVKKRFLLPTTAHLNFDYRFSDKWLLNTNFDIHTFSTGKKEQIKHVSSFTISPRYESTNFSAFFPSSINKFGIFKSGLGFRTGFFSVGSGSLFTNLSKHSKEVDFFINLKIPVYNRKVIKEVKRSLRYKFLSRRFRPERKQ